MVRKLSQWLVIALIPLMVVLAQDTETNSTVEFLGVVEAMEANSITVNQQSIDISQAQINVALTTGTPVRVEGVVGADGSIIAQEIHLADEGLLPGEAEIVGVLQSVNGETITVNGLLVDVTGATINDAISVGDRIRVHATLAPTGTWTAREIEAFVEDDDDSPATTPEPDATEQPVNPDEFEITGTLQQIGDGLIVVSGQPVSVVGAEFQTPLILGSLVTAHVSLVNDQLVAREVGNTDLDDRNDNDNDNENDNGNDNDNDNANFNANDNNVNDNQNDNGDDDNANDNDNNNENDNDDDDDNDNANDNDDDDDGGNSGSGGGDDDDDDGGNSGRGGGDDDDDNSGSGGGDD
jgi:hypothetical protein